MDARSHSLRKADVPRNSNHRLLLKLRSAPAADATRYSVTRNMFFTLARLAAPSRSRAASVIHLAHREQKCFLQPTESRKDTALAGEDLALEKCFEARRLYTMAKDILTKCARSSAARDGYSDSQGLLSHSANLPS